MPPFDSASVSVMCSNIFLEGNLGYDTVQNPALECTMHVLLLPVKQDVFVLEDNICFVHSKALECVNCVLYYVYGASYW